MEIIKFIYGMKGACFERVQTDYDLRLELKLGTSMC